MNNLLSDHEQCKLGLAEDNQISDIINQGMQFLLYYFLLPYLFTELLSCLCIACETSSGIA